MAFWNRKRSATPEHVHPKIVLNKLAFVEFLDTVDDFDAEDVTNPDELTRVWRLFIERYPNETYAPDPDDAGKCKRSSVLSPSRP